MEQGQTTTESASKAASEGNANAKTKSDALVQPTKRLLVLDLHGTFVLEADDNDNASGNDRGDNDNDNDCEDSDASRSYVRPYAREFLVQAHSLSYDLAVWSASTLDEINACLKTFWPFELVGPPVFIFTHEHCTCRRKLPADGPLGMYDVGHWHVVKKLSKVWKVHKQYSKDHTLALDNTSSTFEDNFGNGMLIGTYDGDGADKELMLVLDKLRHLAKVASVRCIEKRGTADSVATAIDAQQKAEESGATE